MPVPKFVILKLTAQLMTKIMLQVSKIVFPNIKPGYPMLKVVLTCLNYIVPG